MPVYILKEMPYDELLGWMEYFSIRPQGWSEDFRTYLLLSAQGVKEKPEKIFPSLNSLKENEPDWIKAEKLKNSGFLAVLVTAAHKNKIDWNLE